MAATIDHVELSIEHVVEIHSNEMIESYIEDEETSTDSGKWSMPGADLSQDDFTEEFASSKQSPKLPQEEISKEMLSYLAILSSDSVAMTLELDDHVSMSDHSSTDFDDQFTDYDSQPSPLSDDSLMGIRNKKRRQRRHKKLMERSAAVPKELAEKKECLICTAEITMDNDLVTLECCSADVCHDCMATTISTKVKDGITYIPCPNPNCTKAFQRDFIIKHIHNDELLVKYERFRLNAEGDNSQKACPNCCFITKSDLPVFKPKRKKALTPVEYNIACSVCDFHWCFNCHSPWHEGISCRSYKEGDKQFTKWTKVRKVGYTPNCQRCPKCKVFIERSSGCDSMTCNRCNTNFCYKCGETFSGFPGFGDHYKHLSIYGCPYNYLPEQNTKRRFLRGGYLFTKCAALTGYPILLIGGVAVIAVGAVFVLPIVGGVVTYKVIQRKRRGY